MGIEKDVYFRAILNVIKKFGTHVSDFMLRREIGRDDFNLFVSLISIASEECKLGIFISTATFTHVRFFKYMIDNVILDAHIYNHWQLVVRFLVINKEDSVHLELVKILLADKRFDPSMGDNFAIIDASRFGHPDLARLLLADKRVDPSAAENFAIIHASWRGHFENVKLLLADKRLIIHADNSAIVMAADKNYIEIVRLLMMDGRFDASFNNNEAIKVASRAGYKEIVQLLMTDNRVSKILPYWIII